MPSLKKIAIEVIVRTKRVKYRIFVCISNPDRKMYRNVVISAMRAPMKKNE